jgi:hypothetical protein
MAARLSCISERKDEDKIQPGDAANSRPALAVEAGPNIWPSVWPPPGASGRLSLVLSFGCSEHMKRLRIVGVISGVTLAFGCIWAVCWFRAHPALQGPQEAKFIGFANGVGGFGTNVAVFSITNQRSYPVFVYPPVSIESKGQTQTNYQALTVNAPTAYGIHLHSGERATVHVALLPRPGSSRVRFAFVRDYYYFSAKFTRLPEELHALRTGTPLAFTNEYFYSDWFQQ